VGQIVEKLKRSKYSSSETILAQSEHFGAHALFLADNFLSVGIPHG
jgi:hypothetical protein